MNDTVAFFYLASTILCMVIGPAAVYYAFRIGWPGLGIIGGLAAVLGILSSLPFRDTSELPWLPGVVVLFFAAVAVTSIVRLLTRATPLDVAERSQRRRRFQFGISSILFVTFFLACAFIDPCIVNVRFHRGSLENAKKERSSAWS